MILKRLFDEFNKHKIKYCVLRKYENFPKQVNGDVDIAIEKKESKQSLERASDEWVKINKTIDRLNTAENILTDNKAKLDTFSKTLDIRAEYQEKVARDLLGRETALKSNYEALEQAKIHLKVT